MPSEKSTVEEIVQKPQNQTAPILLHFQNGVIKSPGEMDTNFCLAQDAQHKNRKLTLLTTNQAVYTGTINDGFPSDLIDTYIAIRNKSTNKVRIIQVDEVKMKNSIYDELSAENPAADGDDGPNKSLLYKNFGGRKANRIMERIERMKVNVDIIKNQLDKTVEDFEENVIEQENNKNNLDEIRPPFNASAKKIEDVYKLIDIIPEALLKRLDDEVDQIFETKVKNLPISSEFIIKEISELQTLGDSEETRTRIKMYIYMDALISLIKSKQKNLAKMNLSNITEKVENDIRFRFSHPESASMLKTVQTKHKAICYFITLAILAKKGFEIDVNEIVQSLCIAKSTVLKFARAVNVKTKGKTDILTLCLPSKVSLGTLFSGRRKAAK